MPGAAFLLASLILLLALVLAERFTRWMKQAPASAAVTAVE